MFKTFQLKKKLIIKLNFINNEHINITIYNVTIFNKKNDYEK